ncbi:hypothetical protein [Streptomyces sp. NPDC007088]|uniref:hypothetical protein n=1 Tax=Streptomyces sp. NPDC007088 TaxID=3364773 RepID=UPI0036897CD0
MTEEIPQGEGGENAVSSFEETVRRLLRTPEAEAARQGLDTDRIAETLIRDYQRSLLLGLDPQTEQPEAAETERLLTEEAERRGVTVDALIDTLARAARHHPVAYDPDLQPGATAWNHRRGGVEKTTAVFGTPGRGKQAAAFLLRQGLDAHGAWYRERDVTRDGVAYVEFYVEAPGAGEGSR